MLVSQIRITISYTNHVLQRIKARYAACHIGLSCRIQPFRNPSVQVSAASNEELTLCKAPLLIGLTSVDAANAWACRPIKNDARRFMHQATYSLEN
jgi:hypothetical protein